MSCAAIGPWPSPSIIVRYFSDIPKLLARLANVKSMSYNNKKKNTKKNSQKLNQVKY